MGVKEDIEAQEDAKMSLAADKALRKLEDANLLVELDKAERRPEDARDWLRDGGEGGERELFWRHVMRIREKPGMTAEMERALLWAAGKIEQSRVVLRPDVQTAMHNVIDAAYGADALVDDLVASNEATLQLVESLMAVREKLKALARLAEETP